LLGAVCVSGLGARQCSVVDHLLYVCCTTHYLFMWDPGWRGSLLPGGARHRLVGAAPMGWPRKETRNDDERSPRSVLKGKPETLVVFLGVGRGPPGGTRQPRSLHGTLRAVRASSGVDERSQGSSSFASRSRSSRIDGCFWQITVTFSGGGPTGPWGSPSAAGRGGACRRRRGHGAESRGGGVFPSAGGAAAQGGEALVAGRGEA